MTWFEEQRLAWIADMLAVQMFAIDVAVTNRITDEQFTSG